MVNLIFLTVLSWSHPADSLRMETINGKVFIIHQVGEHETCMACRAVMERPSRPFWSLIPKLPRIGGRTIAEDPLPTKLKVQTAGGTHKVAAKETLFSISRFTMFRSMTSKLGII